jgi:MFS family permease
MGLAPSWPMALAATALAGFCATWCGVSLQSAIQTDLPDSLRGRVMSLWVVVGFGTVAIGSLGIGAIADFYTIGTALIVAGAFGAAAMGALVLGVRAPANRPM